MTAAPPDGEKPPPDLLEPPARLAADAPGSGPPEEPIAPSAGDAPAAIPHKLAYSIDEVVALTGIGRTTIYEEIKAGRLRKSKVRGRSVIRHADLMAWLATW